MNGLKRLLSIVLLGGVLPLSGFAGMQGQRQTSDGAEVERLRIKAEQAVREEEEQRDWETKIFSVRYVDLGQLTNALSMFRAKMQSSPELHVLSVKAPKEIMPAIEDAIKRLDVPQPRREAELTIYVVLASDQPETSAPIPSVLNPVLNQLKGVLSYKGYRVLDTLLTRSGNTSAMMGPTQLRGTITLSETSKPNYDFSAGFQIENPDGKMQVLRLSSMRFQLNGGPGGPGAAVSGTVDIPQGQQVVVGKASLGDKALILIMSAKFD